MVQFKKQRKNLWIKLVKQKSVKVKTKLENMDQVMDVVKFNKFNFLRKKVRNLDKKKNIGS